MVNDIRGIKQELRRKYRSLRSEMAHDFKLQQDQKIFDKLVAMEAYKNAKTLLCFISTPIEIDTHKIIARALSDGKAVAVPKCINLSGKMDFYLIRSFDDVEESTFKLLEPKMNVCKKLTKFGDSICVLPGFAFDTDGYRIGFGKGYYDRFLNKYKQTKIGVCYNNCIAQKLPHGKFDVAADFIVTPKYIMTIRKEFLDNEQRT